MRYPSPWLPQAPLPRLQPRENHRVFLKGLHFDQDEEEKPRKNYKWAELLARVFGIDVLKYPVEETLSLLRL